MKRIVLSLMIALTFVATIVAPASAEDSEYENLKTGGDADSQDIYGANQVAQQFTVGATSHTAMRIDVWIKKTGTPATVEVALFTAAAGVPVNELTSTTYSCTYITTTYAKYSFTIDSVSLSTTLQYAVVVSCPAGDNANYIEWWQDSGGGLASAEGSHSTDSGVSWVDDGTADYLFAIWGDVVFQVVGANVFQNYIETGDWLIVIQCINSYPDYYNTTDVSRYFNVQLRDVAGTTVIANTTLKSWGCAPVSIYLSPNSVVPLTYGAAYQIRMIGTFTGTPYTTYTFTADDWAGSDLRYLDQWCIQTAKEMNEYDGNTSTKPYTTQESGVGEVLTSYGGGKFTIGITNLMKVRPDLFEVSQREPDYETGTATNAYDNDKTWQAQVGAVIAGDAAVFGAVFGISAKDFLAMGIWAAYVFAILFVFFNQHGSETPFVLILCIPVLLIGLHFRLIEMQVFTVASVIAFLLFVLKAWMNK